MTASGNGIGLGEPPGSRGQVTGSDQSRQTPTADNCPCPALEIYERINLISANLSRTSSVSVSDANPKPCISSAHNTLRVCRDVNDTADYLLIPPTIYRD